MLAAPAAARHDAAPSYTNPILAERLLYYIFAPIGGVDKGSEVALRSRNIRGPYEWRIVLEPGGTAIQGPHQGGWVETAGPDITGRTIDLRA